MGQGIPADMLARIEDTKGGWGVGLSGMQERLRPFGGRLELESGPTGTTIRAVMPLGQGPPKPPLIA
jgi:signal transduction histidine kinase